MDASLSHPLSLKPMNTSWSRGSRKSSHVCASHLLTDLRVVYDFDCSTQKCWEHLHAHLDGSVFSFFLDKYTGGKWPGNMVSSCLTF